MEDLTQTLKAGTLLVIETGEYSDYSAYDPLRILRDITKQELADDFRKNGPKYDWNEWPDPGDFAAWLVSAGYAEAVDNVSRWHVGSYGEFKP